jgi:hypothetical protein
VTARVRLQMRITACASNQRQLAAAAFMWANEHSGRLPLPESPAGYNPAGWEPLLGTFMSDTAAASPATATVLVKTNPVGWGRLYAGGFAKEPRVFYDTDSTNPQASYDTNNLPTGWGATAGDRVRAGYYCNPHGLLTTSKPVVNAEINTKYPGLLVPFSQAGKPARKPFNILVMDRPSLGDARRGHGFAWNVTYVDGSVQTYRSDDAQRVINGYNGTDITAVWRNWNLHEGFLRTLIPN